MQSCWLDAGKVPANQLLFGTTFFLSAAHNLMYFIGALLCLREISGAIGPRNAVRTPVE